MTSRISGFHQLTVDERIKKISDVIALTEDEKARLKNSSSFNELANQMIENVVGTFPMPLGVAVNFKVDGEDVFVPMVTEEPSVVAAASHAAKFTYEQGGFQTSTTGSVMRGQLQLVNVDQPYFTLAKIYEHKEEILQLCNEQDQTLGALGGGAKDLEVTVFEQERMVIVHLFVDTKEAMGANAVNTMLEAVAPYVERLTNHAVVLKILSNLADKRIVRARAVFSNAFEKEEEIERFLQGYQLAQIDPYRATTHNKGIMNGISAVTLATGNDTRAVEAGAHAYAVKSGQYRSLTYYERINERDIVGTIELPLAVGIVGGATKSHPWAQIALKLMRVETSTQLASIIASVGLAQNFAALRALATEGIQRGHMKLHARNLALMAGAKESDIDRIIVKAEELGKINYDTIKQIVDKQN